MAHVFMPRIFEPPVVATSVAVTITGTGHSTDGYVTISGTKYTAAASGIEVMAGDVITFGVYGKSATYSGNVRIDDTAVLTVTTGTVKTYAWTVPEGITSISIALKYSSSQGICTITVTTS